MYWFDLNAKSQVIYWTERSRSMTHANPIKIRLNFGHAEKKLDKHRWINVAELSTDNFSG